MSGQRAIYIALTVLAVALCLALATCGSSHRVAPADQVCPPGRAAISLDEALAELEGMPTPDGVDEELWGELKDALAEALTCRATTITSGTGVPPVIQLVRRRDTCATGEGHSMLCPYKWVSTPPRGEANRVDDLELIDLSLIHI